MVRRPGVRLLLAGCAALYWELVLIRWLSASVRVIAYYSDFVLVAFSALGSARFWPATGTG